MSDKRTDAQLDVIIARWYGFTEIKLERYLRSIKDEEYTGLCPFSGQRRGIPYFSQNLNPIQSALLKLNGDEKSLWYDYLALELRVDPEADIHQMRGLTQWFVAVEATARQRAEALVKVIETKTEQ